MEVKKDWGKEIWHMNDEACMKELHINAGYRCSMHYHKNKDEIFFLHKGKVLLEYDGKEKIMNIGDVQRITPGTKHRFTAIQDSILIEASTHHEDEDSYR